MHFNILFLLTLSMTRPVPMNLEDIVERIVGAAGRTFSSIPAEPANTAKTIDGSQLEKTIDEFIHGGSFGNHPVQLLDREISRKEQSIANLKEVAQDMFSNDHKQYYNQHRTLVKELRKERDKSQRASIHFELNDALKKQKEFEDAIKEAYKQLDREQKELKKLKSERANFEI